jgi:hypothetical protein
MPPSFVHNESRPNHPLEKGVVQLRNQFTCPSGCLEVSVRHANDDRKQRVLFDNELQFCHGPVTNEEVVVEEYQPHRRLSSGVKNLLVGLVTRLQGRDVNESRESKVVQVTLKVPCKVLDRSCVTDEDIVRTAIHLQVWQDQKGRINTITDFTPPSKKNYLANLQKYLDERTLAFKSLSSLWIAC